MGTLLRQRGLAVFPCLCSGEPKSVPAHTYATRKFVDRLTFWYGMDRTEQEDLEKAYKKEEDPEVADKNVSGAHGPCP